MTSASTDTSGRGRRQAAGWNYPVGRSSFGRINAIFWELLQSISDPILYRSTSVALHAYMTDPTYVPSEPVDEEIYRMGKEEIDRSVSRSLRARERAAARRKAREAQLDGATVAVQPVETAPAPRKEEAPAAAPATGGPEECEGEAVAAEPASSPRPASVPRLMPPSCYDKYQEMRPLADWPRPRLRKWGFE